MDDLKLYALPEDSDDLDKLTDAANNLANIIEDIRDKYPGVIPDSIRHFVLMIEAQTCEELCRRQPESLNADDLPVTRDEAMRRHFGAIYDFIESLEFDDDAPAGDDDCAGVQ
jgi:hypothetical protein